MAGQGIRFNNRYGTCPWRAGFECPALIDHANLFLYDSTFSDEEMKHVRGIGHSSWQQSIRLAQAANDACVGFIHHAFTETDNGIGDIPAQARQLFPSVYVFGDSQSMQI